MTTYFGRKTGKGNLFMSDLDWRKLVENNQRLVWYYAKRYKSRDPAIDLEEFAQIGMVGLIKAAETYDEKKGNTFATYASRCILNELNMAYRSIKKRSDDCVSIQEYILGTEETLMIQDCIADENVNIEREIFNQITIEEALNIIINLKSDIRTILLLYFEGKTQKEIAERLGISQSYVSRIIKKNVHRLQLQVQFSQRQKEKEYKLKKKGARYLLTDGARQHEASSFEEIVQILDEWDN